MSEMEAAADLGGAEEAIARSAGGEGPLSARDAARSLADTRYKSAAKEDESAAPAEAAADEELAGEANAAPPEQEAPGETQEAEPAEEQPPIEPPRSWTKDEKERFKSLPRETQEYLANREQEREREVRRSQNEAADKLKSLSAREQQAEQVRQQYEAALPLLLQTLQQTHAGEFADIKTIDDVTKLAREDWPRYVQWDAAQKKIAAVQQEVVAAQQRQEQEKHTKFSEFAKEQDTLFHEKAPEFADKDKAAKLQSQAVETLRDLGFTQDELANGWNQQGTLSLRDHRVQLLIRDAVRLREMQASAKKITAQPKPPVQRPGVSSSRGQDQAVRIQNLTQQLDNSRGLSQIRAAAELVNERRRAR